MWSGYISRMSDCVTNTRHTNVLAVTKEPYCALIHRHKVQEGKGTLSSTALIVFDGSVLYLYNGFHNKYLIPC